MIHHLRRVRDALRGRWGDVRVRRRTTALLGPQFQRSRTRIEIDLTWACNLRCPNCNRSCTQAPTGERIGVDQIRAFVRESADRTVPWERIRLLGGEPSLHPELDAILELLLGYRRNHAPRVRIELATNGHGPAVQRVLRNLPPGIVVDDSEKTAAAPAFLPFNIAPQDTLHLEDADWRNGCWIIDRCGIGLTPHGYYPCAVAGGIDRIFGDDLGRPRLPEDSDDMADQLEAFCRRCGLFDRHVATARRPVRTRTWDRAYARWRDDPPRLTRLQGDDVQP